MLTALLLVLVGGSDVLRTHLGRTAATIAIVVLGAAVAVAAVAGLGAPVVGAVVVVGLAALWLLVSTTEAGRRPPGGVRAVVGLAVAVLALTVVDRAAPGLEGPLVDAWTALDPPARGRSLEQVLLAVGAALLLLETGNVIVRAALYRETVPGAERATVRRGFSLRARFARPAEQEVPQPDLRGGRAIGPLERILVAGLTLSGAIGLAGAVFAAKGIVRFPEISRDGDRGSKAEYFLVGSLVSWTLALACAALVALAGE
ncbi:hypothetical protein NB037_00120 [Rathayibacter sp. ZW T2_19]|uniref:Uncharacterized protein n=1 Tax=Rathayibacter rubneri TaxID=2950106 RepID=A0A9X2IRC4_9MICO|nr:hypothetical protein [Rathayibacter rubneri]MCM6760812.1 hypothetical protein [Rathayibacter rubneri]